MILCKIFQGGKYFFMEHIAENEGTFTRWIQTMLTRTNLWPSLYGDCRLDSNPIKEIEKVGFEKLHWKTFTLRGYVSHPFHLFLSRRHLIGTAIR